MWSKQYSEQWNVSNSFSSKFCQLQCVRVYLYKQQAKLENKPKNFHSFLLLVWKNFGFEFLSPQEGEWERERTAPECIFHISIIADRFDIFHFSVHKICRMPFVKWNRTRKWKTFSPKKNSVHFSASQFECDCKPSSLTVLQTHFTLFCLFIHITMNAQRELFITAGEHLTIDSFNPIFKPEFFPHNLFSIHSISLFSSFPETVQSNANGEKTISKSCTSLKAFFPYLNANAHSKSKLKTNR